ncbi:FAD-dependent oxidoreductase [Macrococcoides canis]|uniref:FAD-dependent oxidoreductase n=1 Tax=Macrococcoides canis TaxID=1855823 RepID=A0AAE7C134_9STAP|nr:FAD/NAD(P)-binding protein [Macrococcus canis]QIH78869.1 FAD-dependent oxidoreductase [Macrococcus canis]
MRIAIIGAGVGGVSVLKYLQKEKKLKAEITVFDDKKYMGNGRAFQYDDPELLMNYPGNLISMKPNKQHDFIDWIQKSDVDKEVHLDEAENASGNRYYSRQLFGKYMKEHFEKFANKKNVSIITDHARNVEFIGQEYIVSTQDEKYYFDAVFLSPGQFGPMDPYQLEGTPGYYKWPYPLHNIEIEPNKDYAVIGTGLSSVDIVRYFIAHSTNKLALISRDGKVQSVRGKMQEVKFKSITHKKLEKIKGAHQGYIPLEELVDRFKKEFDRLGIDLEKLRINRSNPVRALSFDLSHPEEVGLMQSVVLEIVHIASYIWPFMTREDKAVYRRQYAPMLADYANPMPEGTAEELLEALSSGHVEIYSGITDIKYKYNKFRIYTKDKELRVHYVFNATGPAKAYKGATEPNPLIENLVNQELLIEHPDGGFYVTPIDNQVIGKHGVMPTFFMLGQKTSGVNYLDNGIMELIDEARRTVRVLAEQQEG